MVAAMAWLRRDPPEWTIFNLWHEALAFGAVGVVLHGLKDQVA
jgi:hypothetical protein